MAPLDDQKAREQLRLYLLKHGLKASRQREVIVDVFLKSSGHLRAEELLDKARRVDPKVSQATVYRTLKLLTESGLASVHHFFDGQSCFERSDATGEHHDHLICTSCGTIIEFINQRIEQLQEKIAAAAGFMMLHHKMELYGLCRRCRNKAKRDKA